MDTISLAFQHTRKQLLQPFRFWQWTRLAIVGLLAGELGSGGGSIPSSPQSGGGHAPGFPHIDPAILVSLISVLFITGLVFGIVMIYISSVMRFILFDSILAKECHIRAGWSRRQNEGWKYFLWQLGLAVVVFMGAILLLALPALFAYRSGWFHSWRAHLGPLILTGVVVLGLFVVYMIAVALVHVLTKDFVVPQMAMEGIDAIEGWRRLWPMLEAERGGYFMYVLMKIVLSVAAGIVVGIVTIILALILAVPIIGLLVAAVVAAKTAGLTWNVFTITAAVVAGCLLFLIFFYFVSLISVPVIVFFPAYSIYFFAARYRPLSVALYPPLQPPGSPGGWRAPFPPTPQPAGS